MKEKSKKAVLQLSVTPLRNFPGTPNNLGLHFIEQSLITWPHSGAREMQPCRWACCWLNKSQGCVSKEEGDTGQWPDTWLLSAHPEVAPSVIR